MLRSRGSIRKSTRREWSGIFHPYYRRSVDLRDPRWMPFLQHLPDVRMIWMDHAMWDPSYRPVQGLPPNVSEIGLRAIGVPVIMQLLRCGMIRFAVEFPFSGISDEPSRDHRLRFI